VRITVVTVHLFFVELEKVKCTVIRERRQRYEDPQRSVSTFTSPAKRPLISIELLILFGPDLDAVPVNSHDKLYARKALLFSKELCVPIKSTLLYIRYVLSSAMDDAMKC